jgi:uncharacterized membrane protein (UPF0127 family)
MLVLVLLALSSVGACGSSGSGGARTVSVDVGGATLKAEVAADQKSRERGLSGRPGLAEGRGMLFVYPDRQVRTFWMTGMRFPIDIIWIARGRVTGVERNAPVPVGSVPLYSSGVPADHVLEVPAGWSGRHGVGSGTRVRVGVRLRGVADGIGANVVPFVVSQQSART